MRALAQTLPMSVNNHQWRRIFRSTDGLMSFPAAIRLKSHLPGGKFRYSFAFVVDFVFAEGQQAYLAQSPATKNVH
jgi:hypothetical protein